MSSTPFQHQGYVLKPIKISSNVWIGNNATILGVSIPDNVIVGAGSVVTHDLESGFIYAGNPVKKIGSVPTDRLKEVRHRNWRSFVE